MYNLTTKQETVLQDISQMIEGCPNLYNLQVNKHNMKLVQKFIKKINNILFDVEDEPTSEQKREIIKLGKIIKEVVDKSKDIEDEEEGFEIFVSEVNKTLNVVCCTKEGYEKWRVVGR